MSFVDDYGPHASPLGAKGIGELDAVGVSTAIANAVFTPPASGSAPYRSEPRTCSGGSKPGLEGALTTGSVGIVGFPPRSAGARR